MSASGSVGWGVSAHGSRRVSASGSRLWVRGMYIPLGKHPSPPKTATEVDSTHSTGMHSCFHDVYGFKHWTLEHQHCYVSATLIISFRCCNQYVQSAHTRSLYDAIVFSPKYYVIQFTASNSPTNWSVPVVTVCPVVFSAPEA